MKRKIAILLIAIPLILFIVEIVNVIAVFFLEGTDSDEHWTIVTLGLLLPVLAPFPCLIISVIGTLSANKAIKEGQFSSKGIFYLGIIEIIASIISILFVIYLFYCIASGRCTLTPI